MALRKELLKVKVGEKFIFNGEGDFFTKDRGYKVQSIDYDNGTSTTYVEVIDDDCDIQTLSDTFLIKSFTR